MKLKLNHLILMFLIMVSLILGAFETKIESELTASKCTRNPDRCRVPGRRSGAGTRFALSPIFNA